MPEVRKHYIDMYEDERKLSIDFIVDNDIKYGPVIIDTMTFTFKHFRDSEIIDFMKQFGFDLQLDCDYDGSPISKGGWLRTYTDIKTKTRFRCNWYSCHRPEYSMLNLTGAGCGLLNSKNKMLSFCKQIQALCVFSEIGRSIRCTRIDLAKDCFTDFFYKNFALKDDRERARLYYAQSSEYNPFFSYKNGKLNSGWTFYFGKRNCPFFVRMYDKRKENRITDERLPYWTRLEFEIKNAKARNDCDILFNRICSDENINNIYKEYSENRFFIINKPYNTERPHKDEVAMCKEFRNFINSDLSVDCSKLVFCEELLFLGATKKNEFRKKMLNAYIPHVFEGLTNKEIMYCVSNGVYAECEYKIDKENGGIWCYYRSKSGNIEDDIPFYKLDVPPEFFDLYYEAGSGELSLDDLKKLVDEAYRIHFNVGEDLIL